ncbi:DMT family transporter [Enhydrobacter sp.]|jgi:drug/metabolite transporter (DMT)-like permease|uniref:DMT family transporter n=1 Tax=Enhydrobacter sp. TaxID=1894999 RepID=UPI00262044C1|nr:DMT family transporter [Enhydrobacter sp.]WIM12253.1 MAG: Permease of the drug/metabolite transporter (DMT) superfamily [Enhydrobacter sp.]
MQQPLRIASLTVLAMLAFAGNSLLCRLALRDTTIDAASFTSIRLVSGAVMLAILMAGRGARPWTAGTWPAAAMLFAYAVTFSFAYRQLTAATGALLLFGAVQITMLGYGLATGERLQGLQWLGLSVAVAGLVGLLLPGIAAPPLMGAAFMLAAGAAWGVYSLLGRGVTDPVAGTAGNFLRAVPFTIALSLATTAQASFDATGILYAVASGAITSGLGYVFWYAALPAFKAASAATVQLSVPALAALGGVLLLAEPLSPRLLIASVAILGGIALVILRRR